VRWWDRWLKGADNGVMDEPTLRAWMPEAWRPSAGHLTQPGRWLAADSWPPKEGAEARSFRLGRGTLTPAGPAGPGAADGGGAELLIRGAQSAAGDLGQWGGHGDAIEFPGDQRSEDGLSLSFDTEPLAGPVEILGLPVVRLDLAADQPLALVAVRLCDVWPDGVSTLITRGLKNLTHRESDADPEPLVPGQRYTVNVPLNAIGYQVPAGHRLRLAVSPTYWPWAWPSPDPVTLSLFTAGSSVDLPVWTDPGQHAPPAHFAAPERAPMPPHARLNGDSGREVRRDVATGTVQVIHTGNDGHRLLDDGLEYREQEQDLFEITEDVPLSAIVECKRTFSVRRGEWRVTVRTVSTMSATAADFQVTNVLDAYEGDQRVFAKTWHSAVPRDGV
jgi:uncharacterized protein